MDRSEERKIFFAKTDYRGKEQIFGIKAKDRLKHVYVIGKTGMGKSTMLENMAIQDIQNGNGIAFIDPHGSSAEELLNYVPEERVQDVVYLAPFDMDYPISFNVMEDVGYDKRHLVVSNLMSAFKKIWVDAWSSRMEYLLTNALLALIEYPDSTLLSVNRMFIDKDFRKKVLEHVTDPIIKSFWLDEFTKYTDRYTQEATPAIQNKVGQFVSNPVIRNIIGQPKSSFDIREIMDNKKILIMNLSKGRMGDVNSKLLGSMLIIKIYLAAMSRADTTASELAKTPPFYFYVDEFQSFANETFADILSESRKYKLSLTIAHQYIGQMLDEVRDAIFGNVGTLVTFRIGAEDAEMLEKEFNPTFLAEDMVNMGAYQIYLKLMIDGLASRPFSAMTMPRIEPPTRSFREEIIKHSRETYGEERAKVEMSIRERQKPIVVEVKRKEERESMRGEKQAAPFTPRRVEGGDRGRSTVERRGETDSHGRSPAPRYVPPERKKEQRAEEVPSRQQATERTEHQPFKKALVSTVVTREVSNVSRAGTNQQSAVPRERAQSIAPQKSHQNTQERQQKDGIPLKFLKQNSKGATDGQRTEHLSELQKALREALQEEKKATIPETNKPTQERHSTTSGGSSPVAPRQEENLRANGSSSVNREQGQNQKEENKKSINEIPEDELREVLRVDGK